MFANKYMWSTTCAYVYFDLIGQFHWVWKISNLFKFFFQLLTKLLILYTQVSDTLCYAEKAFMIKQNFPDQRVEFHELWLKCGSS